MLKALIYTCFVITAVVPALAQPLSDKSEGELRSMLQKSRQDSNRVLVLKELGRKYLIQVYVDRKMYLLDTSIELFSHAARLSDTLQLTKLKCESLAFEGEACFVKGNMAAGRNRFITAASIYHEKSEWQAEARTWLWFAMKINWQEGSFAEIDTVFNKAIRLYKQVHNVGKEAAARRYLADYLSFTGRFMLAEKELLQALDLLRQIGDPKAYHVYLSLSSTYRYRGSYEKALLYATKGVENADRYKDTVNADMFYGELALVYDELGRAEESGQWYRRTLEKRIEGKKDRKGIFRTEGFLIRQLIKLKKSKEALALLDSLVDRLPPKNAFERGAIAQSYAYCFDGLRRYQEAERSFLAMSACYKDAAPEHEIVSLANMDLGRFYLQHGQFKKAHIYLDTALVYRSDDRLLDIKELFQLLFIADSSLGDYSAAVKDLKQYQVLNDSIFNERKSRQIEELTVQYETEKKEQSIRLLEKERSLQKNELIQVQNTRSWILGVAILLIIIVGLLVNHARVKQLTNRKLQLQQAKIEKKNHTLQHLVAEKEWLVREIHHRVKNNFHMVMGLLRTQTEYLQGEEAKQAVTESQQRIQAMSLVHQRLFQSDNLSDINMAEYIHELVDCLKDSFHASQKIRFQLQIEQVKLDVSHGVPLGLILNEAITNSLKHAFPGKKEGMINISLRRTSQDHFQLSVRDNGIGMPAAFDGKKQASMGMKLMRGLSDDIDATFQVNSNDGTEIVLDFKA